MKMLVSAAAAALLIALPATAGHHGDKHKDGNKAEYAKGDYVKPTTDIVETAAAAGSFTTLLAAAEAADLVDALKGEGPLTVFAPTDEAFAKLPEGTVESLLLPENKYALAGILKMHVIAGKVKSKDLAGKTMTAETLNGTVAIDGTDGVTVNGAAVTTADIKASNGIIHVIDAVLLPAS
ncbi:MAG: fasciclin domain-containing protein [Hyphomonas sp.]